MPLISPISMIKARFEKRQEKRQALTAHTITQAAQKVEIPLDQLDLSITGRDYSRARRARGGSIPAYAALAASNIAMTGITAGLSAPLNVPAAALNLAAIGGELSRKGNDGSKKVNKELLSRTDAEDLRCGATKKYFNNPKQAMASVQAGMEKLNRHLVETDEQYIERILSGKRQFGVPGIFTIKYGPHANERERINQGLPSHGDGRVYSVPFYTGGKSSLIVKTTSLEKALELRDQAQAQNPTESALV